MVREQLSGRRFAFFHGAGALLLALLFAVAAMTSEASTPEREGADTWPRSGALARAGGGFAAGSSGPDGLVRRTRGGATDENGVDEEFGASAPDAEVEWIEPRFAYRPPSAPPPRWIHHEIMPGERLTQIAERYGVKRNQVLRWNHLSQKRPRIFAGQKLKIKAERFGPPRIRAHYRVHEGDTWRGVASAFALTRAQLRRANRGRSMIAGAKLNVWADSAIPDYGQPKDITPTLEFDVPKGGVGIGYPYRGRLKNGIQLPESPLYTRRVPGHEYGTSRTIELLLHSIAVFRHDTGFEGEVIIGGISRIKGGHFPPHRSHRSGRDVDIGLPAFPGFPKGTRARGGQVDWGATWALIRTFLDTGQVKYIFLSYRLQKKLYEAARSMGATDEELDHYIQWPRGPRSRDGVVRHSRGHWGHFHLRFTCGPNERSCRDR